MLEEAQQDKRQSLVIVQGAARILEIEWNLSLVGVASSESRKRNSLLRGEGLRRGSRQNSTVVQPRVNAHVDWIPRRASVGIRRLARLEGDNRVQSAEDKQERPRSRIALSQGVGPLKLGRDRVELDCPVGQGVHAQVYLEEGDGSVAHLPDLRELDPLSQLAGDPGTSYRGNWALVPSTAGIGRVSRTCS